MRRNFKGLTVRGDALSCGIPLGLDTYYGCEYDCAHCCFTGLWETWGRGEYRALDLEWFEKRMRNGVDRLPAKNASELTRAIWLRKTMRVGNRYDPFGPQELELGVAKSALEILRDLDWSIKLETKRSDIAVKYADLLIEMKAIITFTVHIGLEDDRILEWDERIIGVYHRLEVLKRFAEEGLQVGVVGEPFIPGYHTIEQFKYFVNMLQHHGIYRFNTYNLRLTPHNLKKLAAVGIDIEKVYHYSSDEEWREILIELIEIAKREGMIMGCPDFVNSGTYVSTANTCCGVDVPGPSVFNWPAMKKRALRNGSLSLEEFLLQWEGIGDLDEARSAFFGSDDSYSLADIGIFELDNDTWRLK